MTLTNILSSCAAACLDQGGRAKKVRAFCRAMLPHDVVQAVHKLADRRRFDQTYLMHHIVSDLSSNEKWALLAALLEMQRAYVNVEYLEIGVYAGGTIRFLAERTAGSVRFTGIDLFEDFVPNTDNTHVWKNYTREQVAAAANTERAVFYKGDSVPVLESLNEKGDRYHFVFIDGNHTYLATKADFEAAERVLHPDGIIAFHNCSPGFSTEDQAYLLADGGPWRVTEELRRNSDFQLEFQVDRIRMFRKL